MTSKTDILFVGSSHFGSHHGFKGPLVRSNSHPKIGQARVISLSGGFLDKIKIRLVKEQALFLHNNTPLLIVLMMSCNFLRKFPNQVEEIYQTHCDLLSDLWAFNNIKVILCGCIPSPRTHYYTQEPFNTLDRMFESLAAAQSPKIRFFNTAELFTRGVSHKLRHDLYKDNLHLNKLGSSILVGRLHEFIVNIF